MYALHHPASPHYRYSQPVLLSPQRLRFHPRDDGTQRIIDYQLNILTPEAVVLPVDHEYDALARHPAGKRKFRAAGASSTLDYTVEIKVTEDPAAAFCHRPRGR